MTDGRRHDTEGRWSRRRKIYAALIAAGFVAVFALGYFLAQERVEAAGAPGADGHDHTAVTNEKGEVLYWTCSMHPQIKAKGPGKCPICFMDLIPVYAQDDSGDAGAGAGLALSKTARELAEVETSPVEYRQLSAIVNMVGKIEYDETRLAQVAAWAPGRIDELFVNYTGVRVNKGDPLTSIYSPDLRTAEEEYLIAHRYWESATGRGNASEIAGALAGKNAVRKKLELLGILPEQIESLEKSGAVDDHTTIYAPAGGTVITREAVEGQYVSAGDKLFSIADLSTVWAVLDAYESDIALVRYGQKATFETDAWPGETFTGTVAFVQPFLTEATRTVKVRVDVPNPDDRLKPGMFARARLEATLDEAGNIAAPDAPAEKALSIPATAPLLTGKRAVVYVEERHDDSVRYAGREVELGRRAGDYYIVVSGLKEGERVVTSGNFKIDAAAQIRAMPSMMAPEGGGAPAHEHGGMQAGPAAGQSRDSTQMSAPAASGHAGHGAAADGGESSGATATATEEVPAAFKAQLSTALDAYLGLQSALASDDFAGAQTTAQTLSKSLAAADMKLLSGATHEEWMKIATPLRKSVDEAAKAAEIAATRAAFEAVSNGLIAAAERFGPVDDKALYVVHCPMAFDGRGADWLSRDKAVRNPYYGAMMYGCGEITRQLQGEPEGK